MIFPKRDAIYQNLNTSFTNFGELLVDLKENSFTGVVQVSYWEYEGVLLLDNGNIINAIEEINGNVVTGQTAVKKVTDKAKEKDGAISVFHQRGEMITMLASVAKSEVIYKDLSTEFTSLDALIKKLQSEEHTGYIEVAFEENQQKGYIFLLEGSVIDSLLSSRGEESSGPAIINRILGLTTTASATFSVYKAIVEEALSESEVIKVSFNLPQLLEVWGAIISVVESVTDDNFGQGEFLNSFKDTLIDNADEYPFLDPFAAKFKYAAGEVIYTGEVTKNFSQAIGKCLWDTIGTLAERSELDGNEYLNPIRAGLEELKGTYQAEIDRFNLKGILPGLF